MISKKWKSGLGDNTIVLVIEARPLHRLSATWRAPRLIESFETQGILGPFRSGWPSGDHLFDMPEIQSGLAQPHASEFLHEQLDVSDNRLMKPEQHAIERSSVRQMTDPNPSEKRRTPLQIRLSVFASSDFSISNKNPEGC